MTSDPFETSALRSATLHAWRSSPTRFREDANAEEDLVLGGYRDRWFVELAQNAADAAARAGRPGIVRLSTVDGELRFANTGAPLSRDGVAALASLRASAKRDDGTAGRFGVGFAAVLPVSTEPVVASTTGAVRFSALRTVDAVAGDPALRAELDRRSGRVPVLRLVWSAPDQPGPPLGFDTEVRLPLVSGDPSELLSAAAAQVPDVLLAFPSLRRVELPGLWWERDDVDGGCVLRSGDSATRWLLARSGGVLPSELLLGAEDRHRPGWSVCWAVAVDPSGVPRPFADDVLHAPTPTDERLSLPARLLAVLPVEPSRRRVRPGPATDHVLAAAASAYPTLVRALPPAHRTALVPPSGFPHSEVDAHLRAAILTTLRSTPWLPAAADASGREVAPGEACVVDVPSVELTALLAELVPGLVAAELAEPRHAQALAALGVRRLGAADVVAVVSGVEREPSWWRGLYAALAPLAEAGPSAREDLAALPVPLADGRTVTGPRTTVLLDAPITGVPGLRVVHPDADHPLLRRLGAQPSGARAVLESAELREAVERSVDDAEAGLDVAPLADAVLRLTAQVRWAPDWLGALALPDDDGQWRRADELVLPDGRLRSVLDFDGPIGVLRADPAWDREALVAAGVLDGFAVVEDEHPVDPDHELADEEQWWDGLASPPERLLAVRDLDLVDDDAWPRAIALIAADPAASRALHSQPSYTGWWLSRYARLGGRAPRHWRLPSATALAGLYDPVPADGLDERVLAAAGVRSALDVTDAEDAADLLARLADPRRDVPAATALAAHAALVEAAVARRFELDDVEPPVRVRALSGAVVTSALVLDRSWLGALTTPDGLVAGGDPAVLSQLLDVSVASDDLTADVISSGEVVAWARLPEVAAAADALGIPVPPGTLVRHESLRVRTPEGAEHAVPYWIDADGVVHAADPVRALIWVVPDGAAPG